MDKYQNLYVESDILLVTVIFNHFWNIYLEIYGLDAAQRLV